MLLLIKLLITPILTGIITYIERRFGPHIAGIFIGLPLTSGPISLFLATEQGIGFSSKAASGTVIGIIAIGAFCVAYVWCAQTRNWLWSLTAALVAFGVVAALFPASSAGFASMMLMGTFSLAVSWFAVNQLAKRMTVSDTAGSKGDTPMWNLVVRILIATVSIMFVTTTSSSLGPQLSGLLSSLPILSAILIGFSHAKEGSVAATALIRGLLGGCFPALAFFATINLLQHYSDSIGFAYSSATVVTLVLSGIIGWVTQPRNALESQSMRVIDSEPVVLA